MIFRQSIKSVLRAGKKTSLFFALIFALTLVFSLGVSLWSSIAGFLDECEDAYTTIGLFEYMGADYPDETVWDDGLPEALEQFNYEAVANNKSVTCWDAGARALGYTEGYKRNDNYMYNSTAAVIVVRCVSVTDYHTYWCRISDELYSFKDRQDMNLFVASEVEMELGHYYLVSGAYIENKTSNPYFYVLPFTGSAASEAGVSLAYEDAIVDITNESGKYTLPEHTVFHDIAKTFDVVNNCLSVFATDRLESLQPFQQELLHISEGRSFTPEEYRDGAKVCVVSDQLCAKLGLKLGDTLPVSLCTASDRTVYESYWAGTGFDYELDYTIVGITNTEPETSSCVFTPKSADVDLSGSKVGYTIGTATLKNSDADSFYLEMLPLLPDRVQLTIYDQGYSSVAAPFVDILRVAVIVTSACALVALAVLVLFGYLFVYRQRDVSQVMLRLGAGKKNIYRYFMYGSGLVALCSAAVGSVCGMLLSGRLGRFVTEFAAGYSTTEAEYSNASLSVFKGLTFTPSQNPLIFIISGLAVFAAAVCACLFFARRTFVAKRPRKRIRTAPVKPAQSSVMRGGPWKYALLSIRRGGVRTAASPLLAIMAVLFLCQLVVSSRTYATQLETIKNETVLHGSCTDIRGRNTGALVVQGNNLSLLGNSGYIEDLDVSMAFFFYYLGVHTGIKDDSLVYNPPTGEYAYETFMNRIEAGPKLIFTNNMATAPQFYFSSTIVTEFLEGYDASCLAEPYDEEKNEYGALYCILSTDFMNGNGLKLGDFIRIHFYSDSSHYYGMNANIDLLIVGSYVKEGVKDNIYAQLGGWCDPTWFTSDDPEALANVTRRSANSVSFTLKDASQLSEFKEFLLEHNYSSANRARANRTFLVLEDKAYNGTTGTLSQQIRYAEVLYPCLYALVAVIGFVAAFLLIQSRKRELAIMRSLGEPFTKAAAAFFLEQTVLCPLGALLGVLISALRGSLTGVGALLSAAFVLCWFIGCGAALLRANSSAILFILREEE